MSGRTSAATERALARVKAGDTPYSAAKAEGISLTTIYRAVRRTGVKSFEYEVGRVVGRICEKRGEAISVETLNRIFLRPDRARHYLAHLPIDLAQVDFPKKPDGWKPRKPSQAFWAGYCHGLLGKDG